MSDIEVCSICQRQPEDILMLECTHDLCVGCAADSYTSARQRQPDLTNSNMFDCDICGVKTQLDKTTVLQLEKIGIQRSAVLNIPKPRSNKSNTVQQNTTNSKLLQFGAASSTSTSYLGKDTCLQHREQAIYFCEDCKSSTLCAECVLGSRHKGHQVHTYKKAIALFLKQVEDDMGQQQMFKAKAAQRLRFVEDMQKTNSKPSETYSKQNSYFFIHSILNQDLHRILNQNQTRILGGLAEAASRSEGWLRTQLQKTTWEYDEINKSLQQMRQLLHSRNKYLLKYEKSRKHYSIQQRLEADPEPEVRFVQTDLTQKLTLLLSQITIQEAPRTNNILLSNQKPPETPQQPQPIVEMSASKKMVQILGRQRELPAQSQRVPLQMPSSQKKSVDMITPSKSHARKSITLASDIINKIQARHRKFDS